MSLSQLSMSRCWNPRALQFTHCSAPALGEPIHPPPTPGNFSKCFTAACVWRVRTETNTSGVLLLCGCCHREATRCLGGTESLEGLLLTFGWLQLPSGGFPGGSVVKSSPASGGDTASIPGSGRSPGGRNGNPLQHPCLENRMDRGACGLQSMGSQRVRHD